MPVIQSKVSEKEKNKYHILTHIYEIQKNSTDEPIYRKKWRHRHREWSGRHSQGKKRVGQIEKVALTCKHYHV